MIPDTQINIHFTGAPYCPASDAMKMIQLVDDAAFEAQRNDLEMARLEKVADRVSIDAALYRMESYRGHAYCVEAFEKGSLIIAGVSAALAYWVLQNTVGESFKDAYKETSMHSKLKEFFLWRAKRKPEEIHRQVERNARVMRYTQQSDLHVEQRIERADRPNDLIVKSTVKKRSVVTVDVFMNETDVPPTYRDVERNSDVS